MKKMFLRILGCATTSAMLLTGCNNEIPADGGETTFRSDKLSFVLPLGKKDAVTYATNIQGEDDEYALDNLFIYWFIKDGSNFKLNQVFSYVSGGATNDIALSNTTVTATTPSTVATVTVGDATEQSHFYIVANVNLAGKPVKSSGLTNLGTGTLESAFTALLTDTLAKTGANLAPLVTPLPMSINASGTGTTGGYVNVADPSTAGVINNVYLKRRVARFDIVNNADYSNFKISRIIISSAQRRGWILDKPFGSETWTSEAIGKGSTLINGQNANGTASAKVDADCDGIYDDFQLSATDAAFRDSLELNKAVFYLWPTLLKQNTPTDAPLGTTEIVVEGSLNGGASRMYRLKLTADKQIEANKIYKIKVFRSIDHTIEFNLEVENWAEDSELETVGSNKIIDWSKASFTASKASEDGTTVSLTQTTDQTYQYCTATGDSVTLTVVTKGVNRTVGATEAQRHTTTARIVPRGAFNAGNDVTEITNPALVKSTTVFTYGAAEYTTTHVIKLPPTLAVLESTLEIINPVNTQDIKKINLTSLNYNKLGLRPVRIGTLYWAPVNVDATEVCNYDAAVTSADTAIIGRYYQWGRNTVGWWSNQPSPLPAEMTVTAPIAPANFGTVADKYIVDPAMVGMMSPIDRTLWTGANAQGPCPQGWHVPSSANFTAILPSVTSNATTSNAKVTGDDGQELIFPAGGSRNRTSNVTGMGTDGRYTTSTHNVNHNYPSFIVSTTTTVGSSIPNAYACMVRAVQDVTP